MNKKHMDSQDSPFRFHARRDPAVPDSRRKAKKQAVSAPGQDAASKEQAATQVKPNVGGGVLPDKDFGFRRAKREAELADDGVPAVFGSAEEEDLGPQYGYRKSLFRRRDELSAYTAQMNARYSLDVRKRRLIALIVVLVASIPIVLILPTSWGNPWSGNVSVGEELIARFNTVLMVFQGDPKAGSYRVLMVQALAVVLVGGALSLNGAVYQGSLRNPMAAPATLGIVQGATLGTLIYTIRYCIPDEDVYVTFMKVSEIQAYFDSLSPWEYVLTVYMRSFWAIGGCMIVAVVVLGVAYFAGRRRPSKIVLIITGQVFSALILGATTCIRMYLMYYGTLQQQTAMQSIMTGDLFYIMDFLDIALLGIPLVVGAIFILRQRSKLELLSFDDDEARSLGINPNRTRNAMVIVCTMLTGVCISYAGSVGFVGFVVPHVIRKFIGPHTRYFLPGCMAGGSLFLLIAWYFLHVFPWLGALGTFSTIIGAVVFSVIVVWQRAKGNADWI